MIKVLFAAEVFIAGTYVLVRLLPDTPSSVLTITNLASEATMPAWFSSLQLALVSGLFLLFYASERARRAKALGLLVAACLFLFLSLDEAAQVHELLSGVLHARILGKKVEETAFAKTGYWMLFLTPLLLAALWFTWTLMRYYLRGQPARWKLLWGMTLFVLAATVPETLSNFLPPNSRLMMIELLFEEIGEMVGITIVLWGVYELLVAHDVSVHFHSRTAAHARGPADTSQQLSAPVGTISKTELPGTKQDVAADSDRRA